MHPLCCTASRSRILSQFHTLAQKSGMQPKQPGSQLPEANLWEDLPDWILIIAQTQIRAGSPRNRIQVCVAPQIFKAANSGGGILLTACLFSLDFVGGRNSNNKTQSIMFDDFNLRIRICAPSYSPGCISLSVSLVKTKAPYSLSRYHNSPNKNHGLSVSHGRQLSYGQGFW